MSLIPAPSPNFDQRRGPPDMVVVHYTGMQTGAEALARLRDGAQVEVLVTDYLMPGMNGVELARQARALDPSLKVLVISGYSTIAEGEGSALPRLAKPFRQPDLARRMAELLSGAPGGGTIPFPVERTRRGG